MWHRRLALSELSPTGGSVREPVDRARSRLNDYQWVWQPRDRRYWRHDPWQCRSQDGGRSCLLAESWRARPRGSHSPKPEARVHRFPVSPCRSALCLSPFSPVLFYSGVCHCSFRQLQKKVPRLCTLHVSLKRSRQEPLQRQVVQVCDWLIKRSQRTIGSFVRIVVFFQEELNPPFPDC